MFEEVAKITDGSGCGNRKEKVMEELYRKRLKKDGVQPCVSATGYM